jgi:hypothetical protein
LHAVISELALDLIFDGEVLVLVVGEAITQEVGYEQPGIALVGVAGDQVSQRAGKA